MHAHQNLLVIRNIAEDQREMRLGADLTRIENGAEFAEFRRDATRGSAVNVALVAAAGGG